MTIANGYQTLATPAFKAMTFTDLPNKRLRLVSFQASDYDKLIDYLFAEAEATACSKIWLVSPESLWVNFLARGFVVEGLAEGYFEGETGFFMSYFFNGERRYVANYAEEQLILRQILKLTPDKSFCLPAGYTLRRATDQDVVDLAQLFAQVFATYPAPVSDPQYLTSIIDHKSIFYVVEHGGKLVSVGAADLDLAFKNAEITNCATLSEHRGHGLMFNIIGALEHDLHTMNIPCLYSLARAKSPGIGKVLHKLGYQYRGRLINNCDICANFENMNLWVKYTKRR